MLYRKIKIDLYNVTVYILQGNTEKVKTKLKEVFTPKEHHNIDEYITGKYKACALNTPEGMVVHFVNKPTPGLVVHELFHITEFILEDIEVKHDTNTSEVYAYLLGHLIDLYYKK